MAAREKTRELVSTVFIGRIIALSVTIFAATGIGYNYIWHPIDHNKFDCYLPEVRVVKPEMPRRP